MIHEYATQIAWSDEDHAYIAIPVELPGCIADGATPEEALANLRTVIQEWIEVAREQKREIPNPMTMQDIAREMGKATQQQREKFENAVKQAAAKMTSCGPWGSGFSTFRRVPGETEFETAGEHRQ